MKSLVRFVLVLLLFNVCLAQGTIAVMELDALAISTAEAKALTDRLRYELQSSGNFTVIERAMMDEILNEQGFQLTGCVSDACIVEAGKLLAVENIIGGSISRVGSTHSVFIRLVSVETGIVLGSAQKDFSNKIDYILTDGIAIIVKELITSLGAEQLRKLTSAKMPLQNFGPIVGEFSVSFKSLEERSIHPGLNMEFGFYQNRNLFSIGCASYFLDLNIISLDLKYKRFFSGLSIPLTTLKDIQIITPFITTDIEKFKWLSCSTDSTFNTFQNIAWKFGFGLTTELSTFCNLNIDFSFNILRDKYLEFFSEPVFKIGLLFIHFPRLR